MHDPIRLDDDDTPIEHDCHDCGAHHVIDPRALRRYLRRVEWWGYFRCAGCRTWWPFRALMALTPGPRHRGVCVACAAERGGDDDG